MNHTRWGSWAVGVQHCRTQQRNAPGPEGFHMAACPAISGAWVPQHWPTQHPKQFPKSLLSCVVWMWSGHLSAVQIHNSGHLSHGTVKGVFKCLSLKCKLAGRGKSQWRVHRGNFSSFNKPGRGKLNTLAISSGARESILYSLRDKTECRLNRIRHFLCAYDMNKVWILKNYCFWHTGL